MTMYYRYKVKRKKGGALKTLFFLTAIITIIYLGYNNRQYLFFWKYSYGTIQEKLVSASSIKERASRRETLKPVIEGLSKYKNDNQLNAEAFFISAKVRYDYADTFMPGSFSDLLINDKLKDIGSSAKRELMSAIVDIKKGAALQDSYSFKPETALVYSMALYYTGFADQQEIFKILADNISGADQIKSLEGIRYFAMMNILNKKEKEGFSILTEHGNVKDNLQGRLFLASAYRAASQYTNAIVLYREILSGTEDNSVRRLVHINLGRIYFNQRLFRESIESFSEALKIDSNDNDSKIWLGKNYIATGNRENAKLLLNDILSSDKNNKIAKEMLGSL